MSTVKISELPVLSSADAADEFVVVDDSAGVTKKITFDSLATDVRTESEPLTATTVTASGLVTASSGITFGSDTLDDYEEGTWTPVLESGTTNAVGVYMKVGNVVHWWIHVLTSTTSGGSTAKWSLPFTVQQAGGGSEGARAIGNTSWQEFSNRQLGVLTSSSLPDNQFRLNDGDVGLNYTDVNGIRFFAGGSFTTA